MGSVMHSSHLEMDHNDPDRPIPCKFLHAWTGVGSGWAGPRGGCGLPTTSLFAFCPGVVCRVVCEVVRVSILSVCSQIYKGFQRKKNISCSRLFHL